jgi:hypothetical protein
MIRTIFDKIVFAAIVLPLLPGLPRAVILGRVVNVQAWANILLLALLGTYFLVRRQKSTFVLFVAAIFICYSLIGYVATGDAAVVVSHGFMLAPFVVATLLLALRVGYSFSTVVIALTVCAATGAIVANVIHFFHPNTLELLLREEEDIGGVISLGRVSWSGYVLALPLVAQLGFLRIYSPKQRAFVLAGVPIVLFGALLTFNRTLLIALLGLSFYLLVSMRKDIRLRGVVLIGLLVLATSYFIQWWSEINPSLFHLIDYRILYFFTGHSDTGGDVSTRAILYNDYLHRLLHSRFLGQGLGVPVSTYFGPALWADVSLVNFLLPFGLLGLIMFAGFVRKVYAGIRSRIGDDRVQRLFVVVLCLALAVSLNDDIWSHKNFPIYFVYLLNSYGRLSAPSSLSVERATVQPSSNRSRGVSHK